MGNITISLNTRKSQIRRSTYAHNYTIEEVIAGTIPNSFWTSVTALENAFQGVVTLSEGVYRKTAISFESETENGDVPANQTHEEKVVLALELYDGAPFPNKPFRVSVPMPDLSDFVFPAGTDRIMADDFVGNLSANAVTWVNNTLAHYLAHNNPGSTWGNSRALYVELEGTSV